MKPWLVAAFGALLPIALLAMFAAGPVAVFIMLERASDSATAPGTTIALEPAATVTDAEINRLFNDLRSQYLDDRAESITWWLMAAAISLAFITVFVTALGIIVVLAGFIGYRWFRDILKDILEDARRYAGEAAKSAYETQTVANDAANLAEQASAILEGMKDTRQQAQQELDVIRRSTAEDNSSLDVLRNISNWLSDLEGVTPVDNASVEAFRLQQEGDIASAIEKWQAIAKVMEGIDDERAARAWFSIGYLYGSSGDAKSAISAYDAAIDIYPSFWPAYVNRGADKHSLGLYNEAILDYDKALDIDPDNVYAYSNRGETKIELQLYEEAIYDCDAAISRDSTLAETYYHRGRAKSALGHGSEAEADLEKALELADQQGNSDLKSRIEQALDDLSRAD